MLGSDYDIGLGISPVNLATGANTGLRQFMGDLDYLLVVFIGAAGAAAEPPVLTLRQHTLSAAGVSSNLAAVTTYWKKTETTLDNDETWTKVTQAASQTVTGTAQVQQMIAFKVQPEDLSAGCSYVSVDIASVGAGSQPGTLLYVLSGVSPRDTPENMPAPLR